MNKEIIKVSSFWGEELENLLISQNSDILTIILPGMGYTKDKPLLNFASKLSITRGYDVFFIEYGFQVVNKSLNINNNDEVSYLLKETIESIQCVLKKTYKKIIFIGKSIGTVIATKISDKFNEFDQIHILLTPVDATYINKVKYKTLVITGTEDPMINKIYIDKMMEDKNIRLVTIERGNHSLECSNVFMSIDMIKQAIQEVDNFLINNM
ncbi:hypothetical protein CM240_3057 [Clostridium bornimense]|uniref:KANL3/Tex30 alpha/beta hydrolase-like domain-containing protein n=1 Tax=Clostridium bornimense TaxID=1216932 RepID=W6S2P2_9CLOT|nr:alpha/beta family hydrolase [Clostridium bornimense]CDM70174.1 hypothetical protein CM240_3057 [Clostridium bornimense]